MKILSSLRTRRPIIRSLPRILVPDRIIVPTTPPRYGFQNIRLCMAYSFKFGQWGIFTQSPDGLVWSPNVFMNEAKESIVDRNIDLLADTIKAALCTATYVANADDQFIDDGGADDVVDGRAAGTTDQTIGSKAIGKDLTGDFAYFDGGDVTFTAVPAGTAITQVPVYKDTGTPTTSKIIANFDITDVTPNGGDITIQWATPANGGILRLA